MSMVSNAVDTPTVLLPRPDRSVEAYRLSGRPVAPVPPPRAFNRVVYAAAHVVVDPLAETDPFNRSQIDWERTLAFRASLWDLGLGVAEAMDTAQRSMGLDWPDALALIQRSAELARSRPNARLASGCGTDQLAVQDVRSLDDVVRAYEEQAEAIEGAGSQLIVMASRALVRVARGPDDYAAVYERLLRQARAPVVLHWLGPMFDPALAGYWGHEAVDDAMQVALDVIGTHADKVDGIKISLLDKGKEIAMRRRLPAGVRMYTGDDFNYPELIAGDAEGHSDALLGAFAAIAPVASAAFVRLAEGDRAGFLAQLAATLPLARHIFRSPTQYYKTGIVFLAYLNGHQDHFTMLGAQEGARSTLHLAEAFRLADQAGLLLDPVRAAARMSAIMAVRGVA